MEQHIIGVHNRLSPSPTRPRTQAIMAILSRQHIIGVFLVIEYDALIMQTEQI